MRGHTGPFYKTVLLIWRMSKVEDRSRPGVLVQEDSDGSETALDVFVSGFDKLDVGAINNFLVQ